MEIYKISNNEIRRKKVNLNKSHFSNGIYFIKFQTASNDENQKIDYRKVKLMRCTLYSLLLTGIFFLLNNFISSAQEPDKVNKIIRKVIISGKVYDDETKLPLNSATVQIKNTKFGSISNSQGAFKFVYEDNSLSALDFSANKKITVSYVGYVTRQIKFEFADSVYLEIDLQKQPYMTKDLVVTANKRIQAVQEVPISYSVIDFHHIENRNMVKMDEALEYVPGMQVGNDQISLRGSSGFSFGLGSRIALLLDGFPMLSGDMGDIKFDAMPLNNIERIEVIKGAGSALYGTSAIGGVINVISKQPTETLEIFAKTYSGFYAKPYYKQWEYSSSITGLAGADAGFSKKFGKFAVSFGAGYNRDESYREYDDATRWNLFSKLYYNFSDKDKFSITLNYSDEEKADWVYWNSLDSATIPPTDTDQSVRFTSKKFTAIGEYKKIFDDEHFMLFRTGTFRTFYENTYPENNSDYRGSTGYAVNTEIQDSYIISPKFVLTSGVNHQLNIVESANYGNHSQNIVALYAQAELQHIENLNITFGSRLDFEKTQNLKENVVVSPKLGLLYNSPYNTNFRFSIGRGFRAPLIGEMYSSANYQGFEVIPNLALKPEKSWSIELGANYEQQVFGAPFNFDVCVFQNEFYDLIEPTLAESGSSVIKFKNVTRARIQGIEISVKTFLFGILGLETGFTAMDPVDLTLDQTLKYRSKYLWQTSFIIPLHYIDLQGDFRYLSKVEKIDDLLRFQIKNADALIDTRVMDLRVVFHFDKIADIPLDATVNCKNVFNYYYTSVPGNLGTPRYISLQLQTKL